MKMFLLKTRIAGLLSAIDNTIGIIEAESREEAMSKLGLEQCGGVRVKFRDREQQLKVVNETNDKMLTSGDTILALDEIQNLSRFAPPRPIAERDADAYSC